VVAKHLTAPTGLAVLPDGTALVAERTTGRILRVQPAPDLPVTLVRTLTGLDTSGDGGLLDLALSPTYDEDNLIYAYVTTPSGNQVVDFTLSGPVTTVLGGIPKGPQDNVGRIMFSATGDLYVGTGDAGLAAAAGPTLAGKVLRVNAIGQPTAGNPTPGSAIFTRGHRRVDGLCQDAVTLRIYEVERGATHGTDEVNVLTAGADYGWPTATSRTTAPMITVPAARSGVGDCAIASRQLFVTSLDGTALLTATLTGAGVVGAFTAILDGTYGRLLTVVAAPDGALWLTTANKDGNGHPTADDDRVLRIVPSGGGGAPPVV
jgi:glucose/arabinose dehydrogenase